MEYIDPEIRRRYARFWFVAGLLIGASAAVCVVVLVCAVM